MNQHSKEKIIGKRILLTGGTTGIGREVAFELASNGAKVLINGTSQQHLEDAMKEWQEIGGEGQLYGMISDLSTPEGIEALFGECDRLFDGQLDILINNAALAYQSVLEGDYQDWKKIIDTNLLAYLACSRMALARMKQNGHIVLIGSMSAQVREKDSSVYVATKAGVQGFAESLRKEVNEAGISVTLIEPGAVDTDMQPAGSAEKREETRQHRMMEAQDVSAAVIYALSQHKRCEVVEIRLRPRLQLI